MWMGLILWVMNNPSVPLSVVNSFVQIGKDGAHTSAISPGEVFWQGIDLVNLMMSKLADNSTIAGIPVPAGKVAVARAGLPGMRDFLVLPYGHSLIMRHRQAQAQVLYFLKNGRFDR